MSTTSSSRTNSSSTSSLLSVHEFLKRVDQRTVARLVSDTDTPANVSTLPANINLDAALMDATGEVEGACLVSNKYTAGDLYNLTGSARAKLWRLLTRLTVCFLYERRPLKDEPPPWYYAEVEAELDRLRAGERIFASSENQAAGLLDHVHDSRGVIDNRRKTTASQAAPRFFGSRMNRRQ